MPRPDWYFYFLFYLLRIFKWPDTVILGTVGVPTILLGSAIALPFLDLRRERRLSAGPSRSSRRHRRARDGDADLQGRDCEEALASETKQAVPTLGGAAGLRREPRRCAGANLFAVSGCLQCHTYLGTGRRTSARPI